MDFLSDLQPTVEIDYENPDWADAAIEAACPLCAYNLRGLSDPRCPEYGYQLDWPGMDIPRRHHPLRAILAPTTGVIRSRSGARESAGRFIPDPH
ncbi:MAG TPA: hypothetical protein VG326_19630 [Tepidisphaeraceae bacterium]|jgi:hypothetical protein|nr:hypothetical protein [Tepidisphaeraceae bacterium]